MPSLMSILREVPDPRTRNAQRHDLLVIALAASVGGAETCVNFAEFAEDREALLREFLCLENGLPSHDPFSRLFRLLDPQAFGRTFEAFLDDLGADRAGGLAIDGKTLRRSFDRAAGCPPLHVVTAFVAGARISRGQAAVPTGGYEIRTSRALLETLCLEGVLVTADAIHTQTETAALIVERGGDFLFALKGNHPLMVAEVADHFADPAQKLEPYQTVDADHGRIETRVHRVSQEVDWLFSDRRPSGEPCLPGLACIACVQSTRQIGGAVTTATGHYVSSARRSPEAFARTVRAHWAIENSLHWVLDMTFDEDRARNRKDYGLENLAILRKLTLKLLQKARPKLPIAGKRKRAGWSDDFAKSIIGQLR